MGRPRKIILNTSSLSSSAHHQHQQPATPIIITDSSTPVDAGSPDDDILDTSKPPTDAEGSDIDLDEEDEEEEGEEGGAEGEGDEEPEPAPEPTPVVKRKRGRPPRNAALQTPTKASTPVASGNGSGGVASGTGSVGSVEAAPDDDIPIPTTTSGTSKKRRGRPPVRGSVKSRGGPSHITAVPLDKEGNPQRVENDEIVLPPDPAGEAKVDINGHLLGGREYRCRTFTIKGRGDKLYMLSTEPARCIGFRDSYLFFQKHKQLFKIIMDDEEKFDMIARNLIPHSYKGRAIGVVTARSVFREFGARIIVGGRRVIDDYWEAKAREEGAVEGELADPDDKIPQGGLKEYNRNQYVAWHGASSVYHTGQPSVPIQMQSERHQGRIREKLLLGGVGGIGGGGLGLSGFVGGPGSRGGAGGGRSMVITDENWMLEHSRAASAFNSELRMERQRILASGGVYEQHTNLMFLPKSTQSSAARWEKIVDDDSSTGTGGKVQRLPRGVYTVTHAVKGTQGYIPEYPYQGAPYGGQGMRDVSEDVLEALRAQFGEEMVKKVKEQAGVEKMWEDEWRGVTAAPAASDGKRR